MSNIKSENNMQIIFEKLNDEFKPGKKTFDELYDNIVPDNLKDNPMFLKFICHENIDLLCFLIPRIEKNDGLIFEIVDENVDKILGFIHKHGRYSYPGYILEYIGKVTFIKNESFIFPFSQDKVEFISRSCNSDLYNKLQNKYGKSYREKLENSGNDLEDKVFFMYTMLNSNVLEMIYKDSLYTSVDIDFIRAFLNYIEDPGYKLCDKYPTARIRQNMEIYKKKYSLLAVQEYNNFVTNKNNTDVLTKIIDGLGIKKTKIDSYIKSKKYWSKEQKEFVSTLLNSYFKSKAVLTIYDVINILQEMEERNLTKQQILEEKNIDIKYFDSIYADCKDGNPELFELIKQKMKNNSIRGFKKLMILYNSIINSNVNNYESFVEKFKITPDDVLYLFASTEFYDEIYNKITSWYSIDDENIKSEQRKSAK